MILVDANILLRLLLRDDARQLKAVEEHLERFKQGRVKLQVHSLTLAETVWVLEGKGWARPAITDALLELCASSLFHIIDKGTVHGALTAYLENDVSFIDAFQAAYVSEQGMSILSFDRDYDGLGVTRIEPN